MKAVLNSPPRVTNGRFIISPLEYQFVDSRISRSIRIVKTLTAHGENWTGGMRDHFMCSSALQMCCRTETAGGIANAQYNQVRTALLRNFHDPVSRLTVFHSHLRRELKFRVLGDYFVEAMSCLGHRQLKHSVIRIVQFPRLAHYGD